MRPYYQDDAVTLYHGRCDDVLPTLGAVDAIVADPPYGDDHDTDYTRFSKGKRGADGTEYRRLTHARIEGDDQPFDPAPWLTAAPRVVLFGANRYSDRLPCGSWLVWDKRNFTGSKNLMSDGEVAWDSHGRGVYIYAHTWDGYARQSETGKFLHPTQKPVALMRWIIGRATKPGDLILDPYAGSCPVALAAKQMGRRCIAVEVEEKYCTIAARRLAQAVLPLEVA